MHRIIGHGIEMQVNMQNDRLKKFNSVTVITAVVEHQPNVHMSGLLSFIAEHNAIIEPDRQDWWLDHSSVVWQSNLVETDFLPVMNVGEQQVGVVFILVEHHNWRWTRKSDA